MFKMSDLGEVKKVLSMLAPKTPMKVENLILDDLRPSNVHDNGVNKNAVMTTDMRYPRPIELPPGVENAHGEVEMLGDVQATHWYVKADGITWHFVTTGAPNSEPVVFVHGFPESWYTFHNQMRDLSDQFYCISVDVIGHGQSDKRLELDYRYSAIAASLVKMLDAIGIQRFNLGGHDRGSVISDHVLNIAGMEKRVLRYIRMQQSANEPHGEPVPPHDLFASAWFPMLLRWTGFPRMAYANSAYRVPDITPEVLNRLDHEFKYKGIAEASPRQFRTTNMDQELADRHAFLFARMTMPVLFLQGRFDPGQHPEEYENTADFVTNGRVQFIDGNHFFQLGAPDETTAAMRAFLSETLQG